MGVRAMLVESRVRVARVLSLVDGLLDRLVRAMLVKMEAGISLIDLEIFSCMKSPREYKLPKDGR